MRYVSTRDCKEQKKYYSSAEAIKTGLAPDGGLFMPDQLPKIDRAYIEKLIPMSYEKRASEILSLFLTDYDKADLEADCRAAYSEERFPGGAAPSIKLDEGKYILELWHGPTCAFKDMALQIMPRLLSRALTMTGEKRRAHILVATSGDTGKAALEGYRDIDGIDITVFFPVDGVSPMQKLQMTTQQGGNVNVCAVNGNFDDAQTGVKKIFSDGELAREADGRGFFFSSANSINWGRLVPQIVYYVSVYCDLVGRGEIKNGEKVNFCVPTGNFGNIFAAYLARKTGLPIGRLICASNSNCVLTSFIENGTYDRNREFFKTMSPSMDILISSNLERLLWSVAGPEETAEYMKLLSDEGKYTISAKALDEIKNIFSGYYSTEADTARALRETFEKYGYPADTHTSVAIDCCGKYASDSGDRTKTVIVSTASPYKFAGSVCDSIGSPCPTDNPRELLEALEALTNTKAPAKLSDVLNLPVRFTKTVDPADMAKIIFN